MTRPLLWLLAAAVVVAPLSARPPATRDWVANANSDSLANGNGLRALLETLAPTGPTRVLLEPGEYDLGEAGLDLPKGVTLVGSGLDETRLYGTGHSQESVALVRLARGAGIRSCRVEVVGGTFAVGLSIAAGTSRVSRVGVEVWKGRWENLAVQVLGRGHGKLYACHLSASGPKQASAVAARVLGGGSLVLNGGTLEANTLGGRAGGLEVGAGATAHAIGMGVRVLAGDKSQRGAADAAGGQLRGLSVEGGGKLTLAGCHIVTEGGRHNSGLHASGHSSRLVATGTQVEARDGALETLALRLDGGADGDFQGTSFTIAKPGAPRSIYAYGAGSRLEFEGCTVQGGRPAVELAEGAKAHIECTDLGGGGVIGDGVICRSCSGASARCEVPR